MTFQKRIKNSLDFYSNFIYNENMEEAIRNQEEVKDIDRRFMAGEITQDEALELLRVIANRVNEKAKAIAKKYKMKPKFVKPEATKSHGAKLR